jgi:hypothetical protein
MRKGLVLGACGLSTLLVAGGASAQFASDRAPLPFGGVAPPATTKPQQPANAVPQLPGGLQPASATTPAPVANTGKMLPSGFMLPEPTRREPLSPVPSSIDETAGPHAWAVKADHGPWMIMVKSYMGEGSRKLAEKLAADIRQTHRTAAYLFERNGEERRAERAKIKAIRDAENEKAQPLFHIMDQVKRDAAATGSQFVEGNVPKIKVPKPYHEAPEQWVVFIGGFPSMDAARKALDVVRLLPAPKDTSLMEREMIGGEQKDPRTGKTEWKSASNPVNPYQLAMVVPNPTAAKSNSDDKGKLDAEVVSLNKGVEHSLLSAKKPWTLVVKSYSGLSKTVGQGGRGSVFGGKEFGGAEKGTLQATDAEAQQLAKALRHPDFKPRTYEAFVLHHRTGSVVTVGQFDSPNDPELVRMAEELKGITFEMRDKNQKPLLGADGRPQVQRLLDGASPFPVPKY